MIGLVLGAFQLASAAAPSLVIRDANHFVRIEMVASANGPMLRAELLGRMMPVDVHHDSGSAYTVNVAGTVLRLEAGVPIVRVGTDARPLATPPTVANGHLMVPLQLVSEVIPAVVVNTRWDPETGELRIFGSMLGAVVSRNGVKQSSGEGVTPSPGSGGMSRSATGRVSAASRRLHPLPVKGNRPTIIVDAGHGGVDNGMTGPIGGNGPRIYEKNITLAVATKLGEALEARGVNVIYTRTTDTLIALDDRGRLANQASGDLFISIHVNAANPNWKDPGGSRGFETYFLSEARTEDARRVEHMENESVQYEDASPGGNRDDPLSFIKNDMAQNQHLRESSALADTIQERLGRMHPGPSRGVKQAGFRVLVTAYMPAVLVEIGFGTNPREAAFLSDPDKQAAIAAAVADGAMAYLGRYKADGRTGRAGGAAP